MPDDKAPKGMKKKSFGSARAKAGLPSKAGRRNVGWRGVTPEGAATKQDKLRAALCNRPAALNQISLKLTGTQPALEQLFADRARLHSAES